MPYFVVPIEGDTDRVRALLAMAKIQTVGSVSARLEADDGVAAKRRVRLALEDELVLVREAIEAE